MYEFPAANLPVAIQSALASIAGRLSLVTDVWALGGGASLAARGLSIPARDLDLFAESAAARRIAAALGASDSAEAGQNATGGPALGDAAQTGAAHASGFFARLEVAGVGVDVVGGFGRRHDEGVYRLPLRPAGVDAWVVGEDWRVPLLRAEEWLVVYWLQPKGDGREALLEQYLRRPGNLDRRYLEAILAERQLPARVREAGYRFLAALPGSST